MTSPTLAAKRSALSPAKRALLEKYLRGNAASVPQASAIPRLGLAEAPLSYAQQRIWLLCQLEPDSPFYHMAYRVRLDGELDLAALEDSLDEILRRHEILRTVYRLVDGGPVQQVLPVACLPLPVVDMGHVPLHQHDGELARLADEEARLPFDLGTEPPLRVKLITLAPQRHELLLTMHHIAFDGWSLGVLIREMAGLYPAFAQGADSPLPVLPVQYGDFARWQRQALQGEGLRRHLDYWTGKLADCTPLQLPTDFPRPARQSFHGATFSFLLPPRLSQALKDLSLAQGATVFSLCLAAFQLLLQRYSGQSDVVIGTVVANRDMPEIADSIGCLLNTLVIRSRVEGGDTFRTLLSQVHRGFLDAYEHRDLPFETLVEALHPERDLGRNPVFQVAVVFHNAPIGTLQLPGLTVSGGEVDLGITRFDVTLHLAETAEGLSGWFEYSTGLFRAGTMARWASHWQTLLEGIAADPQARLSELPLLTPAERRQLAEWNATDTEPFPDVCLHDLFAMQAARTPDAVAALHGGQSLSYGELEARANRLAHALRGRGVGPEVRVGLSVEAGLDVVVGLLGILKAGGAYVPIDPHYPPQRQADILADCGAHLLITRRETAAACGTEVFCPDREPLAGQPEHPPRSACLPGNAAYLIYTSGSTGKPKGVVVSHRNAVYSTMARARAYPQALRGFLLLSSYAFDSSVAGIFWTLSQGGRLCIPSEADRRDPLALACMIAGQGLSHLLCLPSLYGLLLEQATAGQLSSLKTVIVAGEACPAPLAAQHYGRLPAVGLYNEYGPTEGTVWCSVHAVQSGDGQDGRTVPIGRPIANTQIHLLDASLNPVPVGVTGELYIGGAGITRGYHHRPDLSAERFLPDPYTATAGGRMYRTGDLARYREDGAIEFLGRIDGQVKLRGYRIELGEIEAKLLEHPEVKEAAVLAREVRPGQKSLVAYVVPAAGQGGEAGALQAFLKASLPDYMVPAAFVQLERFPLTPNGKLNRKALPVPDSAQRQAQHVAPRTAAETFFAGLWADLLRLERVGIHDNFFALGGDSILAIQIVSRAREGGYGVTPSQLFQHQTVAELAMVAGEAAAPMDQAPSSGDVPLTPIQRWFFQQRLPNPHHWNQAVLLQVEPGLDADVLERALGRLAEHHDALRLRFVAEDNQWRQTLPAEQAPPLLQRIDLGDVPESELAARIEAECGRCQQSLHLSAGPLLRVAWLDAGPHRRPRLFIAIHHLAVDGVSWRILLDDLQTACRQLLSGHPVVLPFKTTSFKHWAERLRELAQSASLQNEAAYWLEAIPPLASPIPVDFPDGHRREHGAATVTVELDAAGTQALLREASAAYRTEINELLLAALARTLAPWSGAAVLLDLEGHGREDLFEGADLSRTVGWFTTVFPVCFRLPPHAGAADTIKLVKEQLRGIPRKGVGYGLLRYLGDAAVAERRASRPRPQVLFNYLGQLDQGGAGALFVPAAEPVGPCLDPQGERAYELEINAHVAAGRLRMEWRYSASRQRAATIAGLAERYLAELRALIGHCLAPGAGAVTPSDFPLARLDQGQLEALAKRFAG